MVDSNDRPNGGPPLLKMIPQSFLRLREKIPLQMRQRLYRFIRPASLGTLHRITPLSKHWGFERGTPIDRSYIDSFIEEYRTDICGRVLEMRDSRYADRYGVNIERKDVLDIDASNRLATIVADLTSANGIRSDEFDCFLLIQTLHYIYDMRAALAEARRILRPGGVLLVTVPAVQKIDLKYAGDYWRFTVASCSRLFGETFGTEHVTVRSYGNVLAAMAFLTGMASEDLSRRELQFHDDVFPVIIAIRAVKLSIGHVP